MTDRRTGHTRDASASTRRRWLRRRLLAVVPTAVLFVVLFARAASEHLAVVWVPVLMLIVGLPIYAAALLRDVKARSGAPTGTVFISFGRFRLEELQASTLFGPKLCDIDPKRIWHYARGWVEGQIAFMNDELRFTPGRISREAGVPEMKLPWSELARLDIVPQRWSLGTGLELSLKDGSCLCCEVRGAKRARDALDRTALQHSD